MTNIFNTRSLVREDEIQGDIPNYKKVAKDVLKIVWPAMIEGFLVALVSIFDGIMVSSLGNNAPAAVTITKQPIFFMICFITALNIAVTAIVARRKGEKDYISVNKTMHSAIQISFVLSIVLSISVFFLVSPINKMMGANKDTLALANKYLRIIALGFIFNAGFYF